jgi:hypothetical protein
MLCSPIISSADGAWVFLSLRVKYNPPPWQEQNGAAVEKCLECDRYKLEIDNLEQGIKLVREDAFMVEPARRGTKDMTFQLLLQLTDRIVTARNNFHRHWKSHMRSN